MQSSMTAMALHNEFTRILATPGFTEMYPHVAEYIKRAITWQHGVAQMVQPMTPPVWTPPFVPPPIQSAGPAVRPSSPVLMDEAQQEKPKKTKEVQREEPEEADDVTIPDEKMFDGSFVAVRIPRRGRFVDVRKVRDWIAEYVPGDAGVFVIRWKQALYRFGSDGKERISERIWDWLRERLYTLDHEEYGVVEDTDGEGGDVLTVDPGKMYTLILAYVDPELADASDKFGALVSVIDKHTRDDRFVRK